MSSSNNLSWALERCCERGCGGNKRHRFNDFEVEYLTLHKDTDLATRKICADFLKIRLNIVESWFNNYKARERRAVRPEQNVNALNNNETLTAHNPRVYINQPVRLFF
jgi:hypothetical protein